MKNEIMVKSEFAPLKKVILAQSEYIFPGKLKSPKEAGMVTDEDKKRYKNAGGKNFKDVFPKRQKAWELERENLKKVLESYGVEVLRPRLLTEYEKEKGRKCGSGCSNFFVRDVFFTIGNIIIEGSINSPHRSDEIMTVRDILEDISSFGENIYVSVPKADFSGGDDSTKGPFLEGGDVLVLDKTVFVGNSGKASNHNGYIWLKNFLHPYGYEVIEVPLDNRILHLDCALSLIRPGLMVICEEAFPFGIPPILKSWDKIEVPIDEALNLGVNGLPIDEKNYIMDPEFKDTGLQLERRGIHVEYIDFRISRSLDGAFRCSTQPLVRK